ncbi:MAG: SRPBCC family protein [Ignavibacteria bacterium]|nr:SRPBCC family protein [Ignavibacteria bacterium]MBK9228572.1 SRPBCC family protein [Ignavibacteria bacterium]
MESITVETEVNAGIKKVWDYWTNPLHIVHWNFASDDWHCPSAENDPRVGGSFKYNMASRDGKFSFDFEGIYNEIETEKMIAYELGDGRRVTILFTDLGNKSKIVETFDPENTNPMEMQRGGWQSILDNFRKYTENN